MKKTIAMLLALVMIMGMCVSLSACSSKKDYVGVWKCTVEPNSYIYIYEDGTGDYYNPESIHSSVFIWKIEDGYLVITSNSLHNQGLVWKYTLSDNQLLDKHSEVYATKYTSDTSSDITFE